MIVRAWEAQARSRGKRDSLIPDEEDIAESRGFIRRLFEEHYPAVGQPEQLPESEGQTSSGDTLPRQSGR